MVHGGAALTKPCRVTAAVEAARILNRDSGLLALGGSNDMRALGGLDAVVFTGGIGQNDPQVRARSVAGLAYLGAAIDSSANRQNAGVLQDAASSVAIWTVAADEERQIALEARSVMAGEGA